MAFDVVEMRIGIAHIFIDAMRRHDAITCDMWLAARSERRATAAAERMSIHYHHNVKLNSTKYARRLEMVKEAGRRYRSKMRAENPPTKQRRLSTETIARVVHLSLTGMTSRQVGLIVGIAGPTVCRVLRKWRHSNGVHI